jgi:MoaA/NifB/PqqE/SkfB family radical SAM enzyme
VYEDRLADVYRWGRLFRALRATWRLEGRCGVCRFQSICGGSRARAYAATGNFLAEDPACVHSPASDSRPALRAIVDGDAGAPSAGWA